jgi:hypothetical protein
VWQYNDYTYTAGNLTKAVMQAPAPGSTLSGSAATFTWSAASSASAYWLDIGSTAGGFDLYSQSAATATSQAVTGLPVNGSTVYVRLWTAANAVWQYNDYTYIAKGSTTTTQSKASMLTPAPGSTLGGAAVTFTWSAGSGASAYWMDVGIYAGGFDIFSQGEGLTTSATVNSLPTNGSTVYVRLWTALGAVWQYADYTYTASGASVPTLSRAVMLAPSPGSRLTGAAVAFTWKAGSAGSSYEVDFGRSIGGQEFGVGSPGSATSWVAQSLPTDGSLIHVRLWTKFADGSSVFSDYAYIASSASLQPPMLSAGSKGAIGNLTLTAPPRNSLGLPPRSTAVLSPAGGGVPLGVVGPAAVSPPSLTLTKASMVTPAPGSTLGNTVVTFTWTPGTGAQAYQLDVGTAGTGARDVFTGIVGLATSHTVNGIPIDCRKVYVRLSTQLNGLWEFNDYAYDGCGGASQPTVVGATGGSSGCGCGDLPSLRHRLEEVTALKAGWQAKLQATSSNKVATRDGWFALLNELRGTLPQLSYTYPATPVNISLFNSYVDPLCGGRGVSVDSCLDSETAAHQAAHGASCLAGHWNGQRAWTAREMIQEEIAANQAEMNYLQSAIAAIECTCWTPFALIVQNGTVSNIQMPGIITGGSSRSLNNGQGILIPITMHADGTFEGSGSGTDSGNAAGYGAGGSVNSQFGQAISIQANGVISRGQCNGPSCGPDVMHLVLSGGTGPQTANAQARFPGFSRDLHEVTQGGTGAVQFTLPAYIGQSAEQTLLDMGMLKSMMSVAIVAPSGTGVGGAALIPPQQCRATQTPPQMVASGGAGGGAAGGGVAIGGGNASGGVKLAPVPPGINPPVKTGITNAPASAVSVQVKETIHLGDTFAPAVQVAETIHVGDAILAPLSVQVKETIHVSDTVLEPMSITVNEAIHVGDAVRLPSDAKFPPPPPVLKK